MIKEATRIVFVSLIVFAGVAIEATFAQQNKLMVYPKDGQSKDQQEKDEYQCHSWSVNQTGIDPMKPETMRVDPSQVPMRQAQSSDAGKGAVIGGAARGAIAGTAIGAIAGDTGKGAAIGTTVGALKGIGQRHKAKKAAQAQKKAAEEQHRMDVRQAEMSKLNTYNRAKKVCLEGRGYSVS